MAEYQAYSCKYSNPASTCEWWVIFCWFCTQLPLLPSANDDSQLSSFFFHLTLEFKVDSAIIQYYAERCQITWCKFECSRTMSISWEKVKHAWLLFYYQGGLLLPFYGQQYCHLINTGIVVSIFAEILFHPSCRYSHWGYKGRLCKEQYTLCHLPSFFFITNGSMCVSSLSTEQFPA